jgi:hypothetical protein
VTTIGAVDCDKEARKLAKQARKRQKQKARDTERRRKAGAVTREEYLRNSIAAYARRHGVTPRTVFRWLAKRKISCRMLSAPSQQVWGADNLRHHLFKWQSAKLGSTEKKPC